jgi:hypothetical protein
MKHDKEIRRQAKRAEKAERLAIRRAAKAIEDQQHPSLWPNAPEDYAGVARTLSAGIKP